MSFNNSMLLKACLARCPRVSSGKYLLTFRTIVLLSSSGSPETLLDPELEGTTILRNAHNYVKYVFLILVDAV